MRFAGQAAAYSLILVALVLGLGLPLHLAHSAANGDRKPVAENAGNTLCYACHLGLKDELITAKHAAQEITCAFCHGPSVEHMHDEMQVTRPDVLHGRAEVAAFCSTCHEKHKQPEKVELFRKEWLGRTRPNGRVITEKSICTDCHGSHNFVVKQNHEAAPAGQQAWKPLFNGQNLDGWELAGPAVWSVRSGRIVAAPAADADASLWSRGRYEDFTLSVTFRADASVRGWISLGEVDAGRQLRLELYDRPQQSLLAPMLTVNGEAVLLANLKKDLIDKLGWNTVIAELKGESCSIVINGEPAGSVRLKARPQARIGLHIARAAGADAGQMSIREIQIQEGSAATR